MKYSLIQLLSMALLSFSLGIVITSMVWQADVLRYKDKIAALKPDIIKLSEKPLESSRGIDMLLHDYQIDISERWITIYDKGKWVAEVRMPWNTSFGRAIEMDNQ